MILKVFTVFDSKAGAFLTPFMLETEAVAVRAMEDCLSDPNHQFTRHPEDYILFELGEFDNLTGKYQTYDPRSVRNIITLVDKDKTQTA